MKFLRSFSKRVRSEPAGQVIIVDPGCMDSLGHHAGLNRIVANHFLPEGREIRTLVHQDCEPELVRSLSAEAVLFPSIYIGVPDDETELLDRLERRNERLYQELKSHVGKPKPGDQIIVHSMTVWGLAGLANWLAEAGDNVSAYILLMFPPELDFVQVENTPAANIGAALNRAFEQSLQRLNGLPAKVHWSTQSKTFTEKLTPLLGPNIKTLHWPFDFASAGAVSPPDGETVFVLPGAGRTEKGIGNLPGAIRRFSESGGIAKFIIQQVDDIEIANELRSLSQVEILGQQLSADDYERLMQNAHAVIVAYDPARYGIRAGHIVVEALGHGRPVIVTKDTWMEDVLADIPKTSGVIAAAYSAEALGDAFLAFQKDRQMLSANAQSAARLIRKRHSREHFLNEFLDLESDST